MANDNQTPSPIPTDEFSRALRALNDDPAALQSQSTLQLSDFYGRNQTWVVQTFRAGDGREHIFLQCVAAQETVRLKLPPEVAFTLVGHRNALSVRAKRRQGHRLVAQRKERGDKLGNPEALAKARRRKKGGAR